jgi:hypothetical protein
VSALGHYLEEEGIATVTISLIRPQTENTKPPRALWVPFELGRPFGPPSDPTFQKQVILAALRLLERETGPVIIEDFLDDDPRAQPDPAWRPPFTPEAVAAGSVESLAARLEEEILVLRFAVDDVKAYCLEAAAAGAAKPSSRQLGDWFWNETAAGAAIHALREALQASEDERLRLIVSNFMVPAARVRVG